MTTPEPETRGPWTPEETAEFLSAAVIPMRISVESGTGWPLVMSVWFLPHGGEILGATRPDSTLVRCLELRPRCGFEIAADAPPYRGVRGRAHVELDPAAGADTLERLLDRYLGGVSNPLGEWLRSRAADEVCFRLQPVAMTTWDYSSRMSASVVEAPGS